jgi:serine/threonine protein kinase
MRSQPASLLAPGQVVAGYQVERLVGKGGMGEVYQARQLSMDREVALKILSPKLAQKDPSFAKRFVEEARAAGKLNHPNIIHVHDVGTSSLPEGQGEVHYFSMEFIAGRSLQEILERDKRLTSADLARVMKGVSQALAFAAKIGIVHRDIKPDNIMITTNGLVKVADLGLATSSQTSDDHQPERDEKGRAKVMGTPLYISPEQARALPVDFRSDQYSLGATLFHFLTGEPPFRGADGKAIMRAHVMDPVPDPADRLPEVDEAWRQICRRLLAKLPEERFNDPADLVEAVEAASTGITIAELEKRKRGFELTPAMRTWGLIGLGGLVFVVFFAWLLGHGSTAPVSSPASPITAPAVPKPVAVVPAPVQPAAPPSKPIPVVSPVDLTPFEQALAEQRLLLAKTLLAGLPPSDTPRPEVIAAAQRLEAARPKVRDAYLARIATASIEDLPVIHKELTDKPLVNEDLAPIYTALKARRRELNSVQPAPPSPEAAPPVPAGDGEAWLALSRRLDKARANLAYGDISKSVDESLPAFTSAEAKALATAISDLGAHGQAGEGALRAYIAATQPRVTIVLNGQQTDVVLSRLTRTEVVYLPQQDGVPGTEQRVARTAVGMPWEELLDEALNDQGVPEAPKAKAACLWVWNLTEAKAAFAALGDDPLAKAWSELEKARSK